MIKSFRIIKKINYVHNNPVEAGIVEKPEHYLYSSAIDYYPYKEMWIAGCDFLVT